MLNFLSIVLETEFELDQVGSRIENRWCCFWVRC